MGDLHHLCSWRSADSALLPVYLHQVLLQRKEEKEEERADQSEGGEWKNNHSPGEWQRPEYLT